MDRQLKPVELFLALGLATVVGACGGPNTNDNGTDSMDNSTPSNVTPDDGGSEGGEGGEGGEG